MWSWLTPPHKVYGFHIEFPNLISKQAMKPLMFEMDQNIDQF